MEVRNAYREFATVLEAVDDTTVVHVYGDIDIARAHDFEEAVMSADADGLPIVIDLRDCQYIDSSGITVLVRAFKRYGKRMQLLVAERSAVARILDITALGDVLTIRVTKRRNRG